MSRAAYEGLRLTGGRCVLLRDRHVVEAIGAQLGRVLHLQPCAVCVCVCVPAHGGDGRAGVLVGGAVTLRPKRIALSLTGTLSTSVPSFVTRM